MPENTGQIQEKGFFKKGTSGHRVFFYPSKLLKGKGEDN